MKRIILSLVAVFAFGLASAQENTTSGLVSSKGEYYLPQQGDWSIGFNAGQALGYIGNIFNGTNGNSGSDLFAPSSNYGVVGKLFIADNMAYRATAGLNFGYDSKTTTTGTAATTLTETKESTSGFGLALGLGKEWRKGSTRLQGFYGADAILHFAKNSETTEITTTTGSTVTTSKTEKSNPFTFGVGATGFVGAEYFIFPKVSVGAQYQYSVMISYKGAGETTTTVGGTTTTTKNGGSSFGFSLGDSTSNYGVGVTSVFLNLYF